MTALVTHYLEGAFALLVTGCALIYPPLALIAGAAFLIGLAVVNDRRQPPKES